MTKQYLIVMLGSFAILSGCTKAKELTGTADKTLAYVSFTNANASAKTVNVFVDNTQLSNAAPIASNATVLGTYLGVYAGDHLLEVKESVAPSIFFNSNNISVTGGNSYAYIIYDTVNAGRLKGILLTADRNINPASAKSKVRFLNLSPKSPALDMWFVRRVATVAKDSIKVFSGIPSLTSVANPNATALSVYTDVASSQPAGAGGPGSLVTDYIIRIKLAGTNTILSSTAATTLVNGRNYTFFARGIFPAIGITSLLTN